MNRAATTLKALPAALVLATLLTACGDDPAKLIGQARDFQAKNDNAAAIIQLKNALQAQDSAEARFLLGKSLFYTGDVTGAETELRKAREAGYKADEVVPLLAKVALVQGKHKDVTNDWAKVALTDPVAQADLLTTVSVSWLALKDAKASQASLDAALKIKPDYAPALIELARLKARGKDFDGALATLDQAIKNQQGVENALKLRGDILMYGRNDVPGALEAYQAAVKAKPNFADGQAAVVRTLMRQGQLDEAGNALDALKKMAGGKPQTLYLQAQYAQQKKDLKTARDTAQQLLRMLPASPWAQELAGVIELQSGSFVQAETLLAKAVQAAPELQIARRGLITAYLRTGQVDKALATLPADIATNNTDAMMLALAGQAQMQSGHFDKAQQFYSRAIKLDPKDPAKRTSLALSRMMSGGGAEALGELQDIAAGDTGTVADLALINALMARRDLPKALKAIDALEKKQPKDPSVSVLRGRALVLKPDVAGARQAFAHALEINADYFPATAALAALDLAEKKPADAQKRFEEAVKRQPNNVQPLLALAGLRAGQGADKGEVTKLLAKAIEVAPVDKGPRLLLIEQHLRNKDPREALTVAQSAVAAIPDSLELLDALGLAQLASKEYNQAITTFNKLAAALPNSPQPQLRLADAHVANKDAASAAQALRKALEIKPDLVVAQRGLAGFALQSSKPADALAIARDMQKQRPAEPIGYMLEGDVYLSQKDLAKAAAAFKNGLDKAPSSESAIKYHGAVAAQGKKADADKMAGDWLKAHPKDVGFLFYMGGRAVAAKDLGLANQYYQRMLDAQPNNALALNNLAWVAGQQGKTDAAIALAEKANQLTPNQPAIMDTLASLLSAKGEHAKALDLQKKVVAAQPNMAVYKLNLAKIHLAKGDKAEAKGLLSELEGLGDKFGGQAEVAKLKQGL